MSYKVYVGFIDKDMDLARDMARRLEEAGVEVYSVDKVLAGERWHAGVSRGLSDADEIIWILTDNSLGSYNLMYDMGAAASLRKPVTLVGVGLDDNERSLLVQGTKYVKYPDLPKYISQLKRRAKAA